MWNFARAVKGYEAREGIRLQRKELDGAFNLWWKTALALPKGALPQDAPREEYLMLFIDGHSRARCPLGANPLENAKKKATTLGADILELGEKTAKLLGVCRELGALGPNGEFFLSSRDAGTILGTKDPHAPRRSFGMLIHKGKIEVLEKGNNQSRQATRYRLVSVPKSPQ